MINVQVVTCHSTLLRLLLNPEALRDAVASYSATSPNMEHEGMNGYMETVVDFKVKNLMSFSKLYEEAIQSNSSEWYHEVKRSKT
jgi:hypothetical protein